MVLHSGRLVRLHLLGACGPKGQPLLYPASLPGSRGRARAAPPSSSSRSGVPAGCQPPAPLPPGSRALWWFVWPCPSAAFSQWKHPGDKRRTPPPDRSCVARHLTVVRPAEGRQGTGSFPETCQPCPYALSGKKNDCLLSHMALRARQSSWAAVGSSGWPSYSDMSTCSPTPSPGQRRAPQSTQHCGYHRARSPDPLTSFP